MEKDLELRVSELEKMLFLSKNVLSFDEASRFFERNNIFSSSETLNSKSFSISFGNLGETI